MWKSILKPPRLVAAPSRERTWRQWALRRSRYREPTRGRAKQPRPSRRDGIALAAIVVGGSIESPKERQGLGLLLGFLLSWIGVLIVSLIRGEPTSEEHRRDARSRSSAELIVGVIGMAAMIRFGVWASQPGSVGGDDAKSVQETIAGRAPRPRKQDGRLLGQVRLMHSQWRQRLQLHRNVLRRIDWKR